MIESILNAIVEFVSAFGYLGVFIMTFIEGTFVPIPSEITLIPAGYLVSQGGFSFYALVLCSILGTLCGALCSYYIAYKYGRQIIVRYGQYFFLDDAKLAKMEDFFKVHGPFSAFVGRIAPGVKHFISFPAGLAKMDVKLFSIYSALGGGMWVTLVIIVGYVIGDNADEIHHYMHEILLCVSAIIIVAIIFYVYNHKKRRNHKKI